jgi:hypothetical protein
MELLSERLERAASVHAFLPKELLTARGPLAVILEHPDYAAPLDIGLNMDPRPLALSFQLIRVAPAHRHGEDNPSSRNPPTAT